MTAPDSLVPKGSFELCLDRQVIEVALHLLSRPVLRGRLTANHGTLSQTAMSLEMSARSLRINVPWLHRVLIGPRGLHAGRHRVITFSGTGSSEITGVVRVRYTELPLTLRVRVVHAGDDAVVVSARGVLAARRPLHVELAAEFAS